MDFFGLALEFIPKLDYFDREILIPLGLALVLRVILKTRK